MQKITDELIEKFLSGNCTEEEAAIVLDYLKDNPEERYLLDEYERTDGETPLPEGYREEMLAFITEATGKGEQEVLEADNSSRRGRLRPLWKWAAAAAVMILLVKGWSYLQPGGSVTGEKLAVYHAPEAAWIEKYNHGKKEMLLQLPDSSKVRLLPGGRIRYRKDLGSDSPRDVQIMGKAFFDVAKNLNAPFTVYSDGLQTRVLGTSFEVNANPYSDKIKIRLYTGKVLVSLEGAPDIQEQKDYYLSPGQELIFSRSTRNVAINEPEKRPDASVARSHPLKADTISNWYMFNNQKLADVFDQLSAIYNVSIEYSHEDLHNMYFIGRLEKRDSLLEIIQDIALLNHLSVTSLNGKYIIKKGK
ncbi:MAG: DUF4974 domain-containing protein [Chitinophagaceae bacterium]|nr:DUF4974 domain-containing protein [Chitinophagaceae bacterium]